MAQRVTEKRTYEIREVENGWQLRLFENGVEVGGGGGGEDDYPFLLAAAEEFCGSSDNCRR